jgi:hypothetical protein
MDIQSLQEAYRGMYLSEEKEEDKEKNQKVLKKIRKKEEEIKADLTDAEREEKEGERDLATHRKNLDAVTNARDKHDRRSKESVEKSSAKKLGERQKKIAAKIGKLHRNLPIINKKYKEKGSSTVDYNKNTFKDMKTPEGLHSLAKISVGTSLEDRDEEETKEVLEKRKKKKSEDIKEYFSDFAAYLLQ